MEKGLRTQSRQVLLQQMAPAYHQASSFQKQTILEEFVTATGVCTQIRSVVAGSR